MMNKHGPTAFFAFMTLSGWIVVCSAIMIFSMRGSPLRLPHKTFQNLMAVLPEGWAFFTRSPREEKLYIYEKHGNHKKPVDMIASRSTYLFGWNREMRRRGREIGSLVDQLATRPLTECQTTLESCIKNIKTSKVLVVNKSVYPHFCGSFIIVFKRQVPWAWAKLKKAKMPVRYLDLSITCQEQRKHV